MLVSYAKRGHGRRWSLKLEDLKVKVGYDQFWTKEKEGKVGIIFHAFTERAGFVLLDISRKARMALF